MVKALEGFSLMGFNIEKVTLVEDPRGIKAVLVIFIVVKVESNVQLSVDDAEVVAEH